MIRIDDLARAAIELGLARIRLGAIANGAAASANALSPGEEALVDRIAYVLPRVAARVPWRADCLVQATAARRWLGAAGIGSTVHFGVPKKKQPKFEAHAWLTVGTRVVTGGDVSGYVALER